MQTQFEELYFGNVDFATMCYEKNSQYVQAARKSTACEEKLLETLEDSEIKLFEQYREAQSDMEGIIQYDTFANALRFGVRLMAEVFTGSAASNR